MNAQRITLLALALGILALTATACNKTPSTNGNVNSAAAKNTNSSSNTPATAANRFVGTWTEEGEKNDKGTRFTQDGKVIEVSTEKQVGTYTLSGADKATVTIGEGGTGTATLESENRMRLETSSETTHLVRK